ncbi:MAG: hypothetical protein FWD13_09860 [Treponema sp.]|nr:hypothetical protein [Treponema sp.]
MLKKIGLWLLLVLFFVTPFLRAQTSDSSENLYEIWIDWMGNVAFYQYKLEIDRLINGSYQEFIYLLTKDEFYRATLPLGVFRYRVFPVNIIGELGIGTAWVHFEVTPNHRLVTGNNEQRTGSGEQGTVGSEQGKDNSEQITEIDIIEEIPAVRRNRYNTLGVSLGTCFIDPVLIISLNGTLGILPNLYAELGIDLGLISVYEDVINYYSIYPFANIGYLIPFESRQSKGDFFMSTGIGYMFGNYTFSNNAKVDSNVLGFNFTVGINLDGFFSISYTLRTDFVKSANHKLMLGYVFRF